MQADRDLGFDALLFHPAVGLLDQLDRLADAVLSPTRRAPRAPRPPALGGRGESQLVHHAGAGTANMFSTMDTA